MASDSRWLYKLTCLILSDGRVALEVRADIGKSADSEGDARMKCHIGKYGLDHSVQHLNFLFEGPGSRQERRFRFDPLTANRVSLFRVLRRFQTWQVPMRQPRSRRMRSSVSVRHYLLFVTFLDQPSTGPKYVCKHTNYCCCYCYYYFACGSLRLLSGFINGTRSRWDANTCNLFEL